APCCGRRRFADRASGKLQAMAAPALRASAAVLAVGRIAIGAPLVVDPPLITRRWIGRQEAGRRTSQLLARGVGGRDVALGAGLAAALARDADVPVWLVAGAVADAADVAGAVIGGDALPAAGRWGAIALGAGSIVCGLAIAIAWRR